MPTETQNSAGGTGRDALSPSSETDSAASTASSPCLRNAATAAPAPPYSLAPAKARRRWRGDFYDHFLDGAAGVMYTSFLGLILDDLIVLGTGKYKKC